VADLLPNGNTSYTAADVIARLLSGPLPDGRGPVLGG
jgi:hypothetical protein